MNETTIRELLVRKNNGEKTKALADEAGVTVQKLVAEFRRLEKAETTDGLFHDNGSDAATATASAAPLAEGSVDEALPVEPKPSEPVEEPKPVEPVKEEAVDLGAARVEVPAEKVVMTAKEADALPDEVLVLKPMENYGWHKVVVNEGEKETWYVFRQRAGLRFIRDGKSVNSVLMASLKKKGWATSEAGVQKLTARGEAVLAKMEEAAK